MAKQEPQAGEQAPQAGPIEHLVDALAWFTGSQDSARRILIGVGERAAFDRHLADGDARALMGIAAALRLQA